MSVHTALVGVPAYRQRAEAAALKPDPPARGRAEFANRYKVWPALFEHCAVINSRFRLLTCAMNSSVQIGE